MTHLTTPISVSYAGNGSTVDFVTTYKFQSNDQLVVTEVVDATGVETVQALTTHYTVTGRGTPTGGTVHMLVAPASGVTLRIDRVTALIQTTDLRNQIAYNPEVIESAMDRLEQQIQEVDGNTNARIDALAAGNTQCFVVECSDHTSALSAATKVGRFHLPYAFRITGVQADLGTAQASGSTLTVDVNLAGTSILGTKITIANTTKLSTNGVLTSAYVDVDAGQEITFDIDQVNASGSALWLQCTVIGYPIV